MKILAFAATNSRNSINRALLEYSAGLVSDDLPQAQITFLDLNDFEMPIYSIDREMADGIPVQAHDFLEKIGAADALLVSFAEHNGSVTAAWKNIFDWMSRIEMKVWQDKPVVMLSASPGGRGGAGVLGGQEAMAPFFGAKIVGKHGVGSWGEAWDAEGRVLTRREDIDALRGALSGLKSST